ncbi:MAG: hypothetical protein PVF27_07525, partial [Gemmatimonadales bacterium]
RGAGLAALVLLVLNPSCADEPDAAPTVLLDASLSMAAAGGRFDEAVDSARAVAGAAGRILRFGADVRPLGGAGATDGATRVREALRTAHAIGGDVVLVTDGEVTDAATVPDELTDGVRTVLLARRPVPGLALIEADVPPVAQADDSVRVGITLRSWAGLAAPSARVEIFAGVRRLLARDVDLPAAPATLRRRLTLPPGRLAPGEHVLRVVARAAGDGDERDNERMRVVTVTDRPGITIIVDPADWEGRFLVRTLTDVAGTVVRGYARVGTARWVDMRSGHPVDAQAVRRSVRRARLVVVRGSDAAVQGWRGPIWRWLGGEVGGTSPLDGDWYVSRGSLASPLAPALARVAWDSLPPLHAVLPLARRPDQWVALTARIGRRGAARPILLGDVSSGARALTTVGQGLWRWALRGAYAGEAYRTVVAAGIDWLLRSEAAPGTPPLTATSVVQRSVPVVFRWRGDSIPDSLRVMIVSREHDTRETRVLSFDATGEAHVLLEPGVHRWSVADVPGARGTAVVERYSDEYPPGAVTVDWPARSRTAVLVETPLRQRWWLFVVVVLALGGEWAWRRRRGLP